MTGAKQVAGLTLDDIWNSAAYLVHNVRLTGEAEVIDMTRASYEQSSFLDHRLVAPEGAQRRLVSFAELYQKVPAVEDCETRFIFHISHVGSTLISRAVGVAPNVLSLREPILLRWLSDIRGALAYPESRYTTAGYARALRTALGLLARKIDPADIVVVKASSFTNNLAEDILTLQPKSVAVGVYSCFEPFAANVLKGRGAWSDMVAQAPGRMKRLHAMLGRQPWQLAFMSTGELVALNWLTEMMTLARAGQRYPARFKWVNFDTFLSPAEPNVAAIAADLNVGWSKKADLNLQQKKVFSTYSKNTSENFDSASRDKIIADARQRSAVEIGKGLDWLKRAIADHRECRVVEKFL